MSLLNSDTSFRQRGIHNIDVRITSGTVQLQYSVDGQAAKDVPSGLFTTNAEGTVNVSLPECTLTSVNTGTASVYVNFVSSQ